MRPVCVPCSRFYRAKTTGFLFVEGMPTSIPVDDLVSRSAEPGLKEPHLWKPYKLWSGDLWECPGCGHQTIAGVGRGPIAEHYEKDFANQASFSKFQLNDC